MRWDYNISFLSYGDDDDDDYICILLLLRNIMRMPVLMIA